MTDLITSALHKEITLISGYIIFEITRYAWQCYDRYRYRTPSVTNRSWSYVFLVVEEI